METLRSDPDNKQANRFAQAEKDADQRKREALAAFEQREAERNMLQNEANPSRQRSRQADQASEALEKARTHALDNARTIGVDADIIVNPLFALAAEVLAQTPPDPQATIDSLRALVSRRRRDIAFLRRRHVELDKQQLTTTRARDTAQAVRDECDEALQRREQAGSVRLTGRPGAD
ncbi:hypothetical protein ACFQS6_05265 [Xanthomonas populi]|uniref:hypothetical protein n=1 Tax=Xanthomonas populi TaxID=53414 RepID=UPI000FF8AA9F|nr:hypothetical protein [Xanthomonas populi]